MDAGAHYGYFVIFMDGINISNVGFIVGVFALFLFYVVYMYGMGVVQTGSWRRRR